MDPLRREQELLDRSRLRMARTASTIALIVIGAIGVYVTELAPPEPGRQAMILLVLAAAAVISVAAHQRSAPGARPLPLWVFFLWVASVLAFDSAVLWLYADPASDIYLSYLLPVLFAAAVLPAWGAAASLATAVGAYMAVVFSLDPSVHRVDLVLRAATFAVIGLLGAYLAREQQREMAMRVEKEQGLSRLLERAISAQEGERGRVARELHDGPVQSLSVLSMRLGLLEGSAAGEDVRERLGDVRLALRRTIAELRRMMQDLRPSALDDLGLVDALHDFASARCDAAGVRLEWHVTGTRRRLTPPVETAVFRIVQEGVTNIVRHAQARTARVAIAFEDGALFATVEDDGVGIPPARSGGAVGAEGVGIIGMRERAALLGGTLEIGPGPGSGTRVTTKIPLAQAA